MIRGMYTIDAHYNAGDCSKGYSDLIQVTHRRMLMDWRDETP